MLPLSKNDYRQQGRLPADQSSEILQFADVKVMNQAIMVWLCGFIEGAHVSC